MEVSYINRPYKIAKHDRKFKGIVAANLLELKEKSVKSLGIDVDDVNDICVYLAEDETLIDDQDYFATVPENTKLIIAKGEEEAGSRDVVDGGPFEVSESQEFSNSSRFSEIPEGLGRRILELGPTNSILSIMSMSNTELEVLSNLNLNVLVEELAFDMDLARVFHDAANKELVRRSELNDATNLLRLYDRAKGNKDLVDGIKRKQKH